MGRTWILLGAVTAESSSAFRLTPRGISESTSIGSDISAVYRTALMSVRICEQIRWGNQWPALCCPPEESSQGKMTKVKLTRFIRHLKKSSRRGNPLIQSLIEQDGSPMARLIQIYGIILVTIILQGRRQLSASQPMLLACSMTFG